MANIYAKCQKLTEVWKVKGVEVMGGIVRDWGCTDARTLVCILALPLVTAAATLALLGPLTSDDLQI